MARSRWMSSRMSAALRALVGQVQQDLAAGACQGRSCAEHPEPPSFRLPPPRVVVGQGQHLQPRGQLADEGDDGAPDAVPVEAVQREVDQLGVLGAPDPVLAAGSAAVPHLQVRQLPAGGVGGESGYPVPVGVGVRSCAPGCRRSLRTMTRIPWGQGERLSRPVSSATQAPSRTCPSPS